MAKRFTQKVDIDLDEATVQKIREIAKLAGESVPTVIRVVLAIELTKKKV